MKWSVFLSRILLAVVALTLFLAAPSSDAAQQTKSEGPMITVTLNSDKQEYTLGEDIRFDVRVANAGRSEVTVFGQLLWGYAGGLVLHVYDASNKEVPAKSLDDDMVVPSTLEDCHSFVVLNRNHYLGTTRADHLADLIEKPGRYFIQVQYLSPVPKEFGQGPNFWRREKGAEWSNKIQVEVSKK
jgi:hypothetical protein